MSPPWDFIQTLRLRKTQCAMKTKPGPSAQVTQGPVIYNYVNMPESFHHEQHTHFTTISMNDIPVSPQNDIWKVFHSSHISSDPDPTRELDEYIQWLIEKVPGQAELFLSAKEKLADAALDLAQIRHLDDTILASGYSVGD